MRVLKLIVTPLSSFVSFPKGDMIFGHFANYLFMQNDKRLENYLKEKPKIIFSDFLPDGYFPKPVLPLSSFGVSDSEKKEFRKKSWISLENLQNGKLEECEKVNFFNKKVVVRNSINRVLFSTDDSGVFAPYEIEEIEFQFQPVFYVMVDNSFENDEIVEVLNIIGRVGFGKKSSIGKGQFSVKIDESFKGFKEIETNYYLTISPTILNGIEMKECFYNTFNRFGKYSNSNTPFKKPVLMADSGAVIELENSDKFIGSCLDNGINSEKVSFLQGYSILVPFKNIIR